MSTNFLSFILLLIINSKTIIADKLSEHCQYGNLSDTGNIINIIDYYNLSLLITTSKNIYTGFPPKIKSAFNSNITRFSSGITINENYILMSCLEGKILTKRDINNGEEIEFCPSLLFTNPPQKACSISSYDNKVYLIYTELVNQTLIPYIIEFTINNLNNPACEKYDIIKKLSPLEPTYFTNQISCEIISPINEDNFYLVCLYVKIDINYKIYGYVDQKEYYIFSSDIDDIDDIILKKLIQIL